MDQIWNDSCDILDLRLIVIDPAEEIYMDGDAQKESPSVIYDSLRQLAHMLEVPVLCTSHLHRNLERRKNKRPRLGDLKKIGVDPEWLDQIIFLYRDRYYDSEGEEGAELIVSKVVQGDVGTVRLNWEGASKCFTERGEDE